MPMYDFRCPCGNVFEWFVEASRGVTKCPSCSYPDAQRLPAAPRLNTATVGLDERLAAKGQRVIEPGMGKDLSRNAGYRKEKHERRLRECAEEAFREVINGGGVTNVQ